jgi:hypothetical protein
MKPAGILKRSCVALAALCSGCERPAWDMAGGPSVEQFPGRLRVVQARARVADSAIQLDLRNTGDEAMCFWATGLPNSDHAIGFRIFTTDDVEKQTGEVLPAGNRLVELDPGQMRSTQVHLRPWFESDLRDGECVLFEATYFPCSEAGTINRGDSVPLSDLGLVQSSWRVEGDQLTLIPQSEPSCRVHSGLIRQSPR